MINANFHRPFFWLKDRASNQKYVRSWGNEGLIDLKALRPEKLDSEVTFDGEQDSEVDYDVDSNTYFGGKPISREILSGLSLPLPSTPS